MRGARGAARVERGTGAAHAERGTGAAHAGGAGSWGVVYGAEGLTARESLLNANIRGPEGPRRDPSLVKVNGGRAGAREGWPAWGECTPAPSPASPPPHANSPGRNTPKGRPAGAASTKPSSYLAATT